MNTNKSERQERTTTSMIEMRNPLVTKYRFYSAQQIVVKGELFASTHSKTFLS